MRRGMYRSYRRRRPRPVGLRRALEHIENARQLSYALGGSDQDVKAYLFSLPPSELREILDIYEQQYGRQARVYAERTLPSWRLGGVAMSGTVAGRLYSLLPPRMPLASKYKLVESLWQHVGPRSKTTLRVGARTDEQTLVSAVRDHIDRVIVEHRIPDSLERRFEWLAAGDVQIQQQLLSHLRQKEKDLTLAGVRDQLPAFLEHLRSASGRDTSRLTHTLQIGKHEIVLLIDRNASGVAVEKPAVGTPVSIAVNRPSIWAWVFAAGLVLLLLST